MVEKYQSLDIFKGLDHVVIYILRELRLMRHLAPGRFYSVGLTAVDSRPTLPVIEFYIFRRNDKLLKVLVLEPES
jgi:hypothetical protein